MLLAQLGCWDVLLCHRLGRVAEYRVVHLAHDGRLDLVNGRTHESATQIEHRVVHVRMSQPHRLSIARWACARVSHAD